LDAVRDLDEGATMAFTASALDLAETYEANPNLLLRK
jgi:hypothetical protein